MIITNTLSILMPFIGCFIILFIIYQGWQLVKFIHHRYILKEEVKFPVFSAIIFFGCLLFYAGAAISAINSSP